MDLEDGDAVVIAVRGAFVHVVVAVGIEEVAEFVEAGAHGGAGVTSDFGLAKTYAGMRTLRLADGPDEVHRRTIARIEFKRQRELASRR